MSTAPDTSAAAAPGARAAAGQSPPAMLLAGSLALVALAVLPQLGGGYSGAGYLVELVLMPLTAALAWLALRQRPGLTQALLLLYLASALGLPFWVEGGREVWAWVLALPLAWVLVWQLLTQVPERRGLLLPVLTGAAAAAALYGLALWAGSGHLSSRVSGSFGLPNSFAGYLLAAWPLAGLGLLRTPPGKLRTAYGVAGLVLIAAFVLTFSRAAWVVFALQLLGLAALALMQRLRQRPDAAAPAESTAAGDAPAAPPIPGLPRWTLLGVPVLLAGLLLLPSVRAVLARVGDLGGYSMTGRLRFWEGALAIWRDHSLLGVGLGNFAFFYPQYEKDPFFYSIDPHSWPLQLLCELGLPGLLIALAIVYGAAVWLRRIWRALPALEAGLLTAALVGSLLHAAVDFDYTMSATTALLGALLAYGTWRAQEPGAAASSRPDALAQGHSSAGGSPPASEPAPAASAAAPALLPRWSTPLAWVTAVLLGGVALWGMAFTAERYTLDHLGDKLPLALRQQLLRQAIRYNPLNHKTHYDLASILAQPGPGNDRDGALREVNRAIQLNPRYARAYALRGLLARPAKAGDADLKHAIELNPYDYPEHYFAYATLAPDDATMLQRLKDGIAKLTVTEPITPTDVRSDWMQWNGMFAQWYFKLAELTKDDVGQAALYRKTGAKFAVAASEQNKAEAAARGEPPTQPVRPPQQSTPQRPGPPPQPSTT